MSTDPWVPFFRTVQGRRVEEASAVLGGEPRSRWVERELRRVDRIVQTALDVTDGADDRRQVIDDIVFLAQGRTECLHAARSELRRLATEATDPSRAIRGIRLVTAALSRSLDTKPLAL